MAPIPGFVTDFDDPRFDHWHIQLRVGDQLPELHVIKEEDGWSIQDTWAVLGPKDKVLGRHHNLQDAVQAALALLRGHTGPEAQLMWGAGCPDHIFVQLGFIRPRYKWVWWPPGFRLVEPGRNRVGTDGLPE